MRYRLMATYRGSPFEAGIGPADGDIVLFAACPPPEDLGFEPATGHWRKQLPIAEVQAVWESRPVGTFRGERCMVLDDLGDRLHIGYLGHDGYQAEQLGYWQVDRGVFELVAAKSEVSEIVEERTEYPRRHAAGPAGTGAQTRQPGDLPPGAPQDQARYLPPEPQDQASYLLDRPEYSRAQAARQPGPRYQQAPPPGNQPDLAGLSEAPPAYQATARDGGQHAWPDRSGIALPVPAEPPLPLEAAALRAATASRPRPVAGQRHAAAPPSEPAAPAAAGLVPAGAAPAAAPTGGVARDDGAVRPDNSAAAIGTPQATRTPAARRTPPATETPPATGTPPAAGAPPAIGTPPAAETPPATGTLPAAGAPPATGTPQATRTPAARRTPPAAETPPATGTPPAADTPPATGTAQVAGAPPGSGPTGPARSRRSARPRLATERLFAELASLAGIPVDSYAIGEEVEGALCLLQAGQGFEVFHSSGGNRHELQFFGSEEAAYFYLFGVLAAEAVRKGALISAAGHITGQLPAVRIAP